MAVSAGPTITGYHSDATGQSRFPRTVPVSNDAINHSNGLEIITFQCPNYSFKTAPSHVELAQKSLTGPNAPPGFRKLQSLQLEADWKAGSFGLHSILVSPVTTTPPHTVLPTPTPSSLCLPFGENTPAGVQQAHMGAK